GGEAGRPRALEPAGELRPLPPLRRRRRGADRPALRHSHRPDADPERPSRPGRLRPARPVPRLRRRPRALRPLLPDLEARPRAHAALRIPMLLLGAFSAVAMDRSIRHPVLPGPEPVAPPAVA